MLSSTILSGLCRIVRGKGLQKMTVVFQFQLDDDFLSKLCNNNIAQNENIEKHKLKAAQTFRLPILCTYVIWLQKENMLKKAKLMAIICRKIVFS